MVILPKSAPKTTNYPPYSCLIFFFSLLFLVYLALVSRIIVIHDGVDYEQLGRMIYKDGWITFFKTGLNREPFYPWVIAQSMRIADHFSIDYQDVQKAIQILFLFSSQCLTYFLLKKMKVNKAVALTVVFFYALTPALWDSAMNLFSESVTYPFVLTWVITTSIFLRGLNISSPLRNIFLGAASAALCFILTMTKALFSYVSLFYVLFFILLGLFMNFKNKQRTLMAFSLFIMTFSVVYYPSLQVYKKLNQKHNGHYAITDRGPFMFYGNTAKFMEDLSARNLSAAILSSISGGTQDLCVKFIGKEACSFWHHERSEIHAHQKDEEFRRKGLSPDEIDREYTACAVRDILRSPLHYSAFYSIAILHMIFFKGADVGFAAYPAWLANVQMYNPLRYTISFLTASLSLAGIIFFFIFLWKNKKDILREEEKNTETLAILLAIFSIMVPFIGFYALVAVLPRFCLPVASLYFILIAFFIDQKFIKKQ